MNKAVRYLSRKKALVAGFAVSMLPVSAFAVEPTYASPFADQFEQIPIVAISSDVALYAAAALAIPLTFAAIRLGIALIRRGTSSA